MGITCISGKRIFASQPMAEDALIDLWSRNEYAPGQAPVSVYKCDDCGEFHLTSRPPMNERLARAISSGEVKRQRDAHNWEQRLKKK
jgi:hypothetical protein